MATRREGRHRARHICRRRAGREGMMVGAALAAACALAIVGLAVGGDSAASTRQTDDPPMMIGDENQYPDLDMAGKRNVIRARRLVRESLRTMDRFDTLGKARRLGYVPLPAERLRRPGFTHLRKHRF